MANQEILNDYGQKAIDVLENAVIIPKQTFEILLGTNCKPHILIAIYTLYYWTAKWQKTNQPWCTASYVSLKLHISRTTVCRYNKILKKLGLIEMVKPRNEKGQITKTYIKVKYVLKKSTVSKATVSLGDTMVEYPDML